MDYQDKVAIVTGGASGIGKAVCIALGKEGATVIVADINGAGAAATADAIRSAGGKAESHALDVTPTADLEHMIEEIASVHGKLDYMFNNAGMAVAGELRDVTHADWKLVVDLNLMAVIHGSMAAYHVMIRQGHGHIVNTASAAGLLPSPVLAAYSATKFGVVGFSRGLRAEAADLGVKVTVLCPGFVESNIFEAAINAGATTREMKAQVPFRFVSAEDAARRILDGVARNEGMVVFPGYVRVLRWLDRLAPSLLFQAGLKAVRDFRKVRKEGYREEHRTAA
ncbi:MAG TPA: SDR family oxidoreductase [Noviherbaspirillum sp.]|nr:SDR family oxidoreductase [Noviherbaspirillum sp.]